MNAIKGVGRFIYDFIVGDDWKIAAAVVAALVLTGVLFVSSTLSDETVAVIGAILLALFFTISMVVDVRRATRPTNGKG